MVLAMMNILMHMMAAGSSHGIVHKVHSITTPLGCQVSGSNSPDIFDSLGGCLEKGELISPPNFFWDGKILCLVDFSPFLCPKDR